MHEQEKNPSNAYPTGRGYGNDYMRGGEVFGGYGYSNRPEYERRRGEIAAGGERRPGDAMTRDEDDAPPQDPIT